MQHGMIVSLLSFTLLKAVASLHGGTPCVDPAWSSADIQIVRDVAFGSSYNRHTQQNETLLLDAYMPPEGDMRKLRPVAVLVHGGGFDSGNKTSDGEPLLAMRLAVRGWFVVSINYRLTGFPFPTGLLNDRPVFDAVEDIRAAVRFVRKLAVAHRLDVDRVLVGGDSSGAISSMYLGYVKNAQYEGTSGNPGFRSDAQLIVSVSGSLLNQAFCKTLVPKPTNCTVQNLTNNHTGELDGSSGQPPLLMVHGTADHLIPYANGHAVFEQAKMVGLQAKLITIPGGSHVPFKELFYEGTYFQDFMTFIVDTLSIPAAECPPPLVSLVVV
jgi:acetyl esterase/lipase